MLINHIERGWTRSHGFLLSMGGFSLHCEGKHMPLSPSHLERLIKLNWVKFPAISEDEIKDKSKADFLTKSIAVLQTLWFVVQCIARLAQKLALTEVELVTMAFVVLNVALYWAWRDKPLDVQCPVVLRLVEKDGVDIVTFDQVQEVLYGEKTDEESLNTIVAEEGESAPVSITNARASDLDIATVSLCLDLERWDNNTHIWTPAVGCGTVHGIIDNLENIFTSSPSPTTHNFPIHLPHMGHPAIQ